jgi:hypothetical protein
VPRPNALAVRRAARLVLPFLHLFRSSRRGKHQHRRRTIIQGAWLLNDDGVKHVNHHVDANGRLIQTDQVRAELARRGATEAPTQQSQASSSMANRARRLMSVLAGAQLASVRRS